MKLRIAAALLLASAAFAQTPASAPAALGVDGVVALASASMSEQFIVKRLQRDGKAYDLSVDDLVKLRKAGVSEKVIEVMMDPGAAATPAPAAGTPQPAAAASPAPAAAVAPAADPAPATATEKQRSGFFGRLRDNAAARVKNTGTNAVNSAERTADRTMTSTEDRANRTVERTQQKTEAAVQSKVGADQKGTVVNGQNKTTK